jgi:hypothetical protein
MLSSMPVTQVSLALTVDQRFAPPSWATPRSSSSVALSRAAATAGSPMRVSRRRV